MIQTTAGQHLIATTPRAGQYEYALRDHDGVTPINREFALWWWEHQSQHIRDVCAAGGFSVEMQQ
ncbi:MAG: hypothetical protein ACRC9O_03210 [Plesiomonas sp.]|uniref:hypothetical protein n=1 Tax=Plesiomonas sp. TaxID=2486279 RepID=UPI003F2C7D26